MLTSWERMRRHGSALALAACLVAGASTAVVGVGAGGANAHQLTAPTRLQADLSPSGDPNGWGEATFRLWRAERRVCATAEWHRIGTPDAAHIHRRSDGQIVVDLTGSVTGGRPCARDVSPALIARIAAHSGRYYFNVHNAKYPAGAIQGRLHR